MLHANRFLCSSQTMDEARLSAWELTQVRICACRRCPRLVDWRRKTIAGYTRDGKSTGYWEKPVPGFGDPFARLMVVGLAPSAHGSNRTGRLFTGDASGDFLFAALHRGGFARQPLSLGFGDQNGLTDVYLTSVGRCAAPHNRPLLAELEACQGFLEEELRLLDRLEGIVALGHVASQRLQAYFQARGAQFRPFAFEHGALEHIGPGFPWILLSYHPSHQNTRTGRLTPGMFDAIWEKARRLLDQPAGR